MENPFIWLVIGEIIVIAIIFIVRYIFERLEDKKVDKIIKFLANKTKDNKNTKDKFNECLKIIKHNHEKESE